MERRTRQGRASRWWRVCGVALVGGSLLPTGCTRSPREALSHAWDPIKRLVTPGPRCASQEGCAPACAPQLALDPSEDPFLARALASLEPAAEETKTADASDARDDASTEEITAAEPASPNVRDWMAELLAESDDRESAETAEPPAESTGMDTASTGEDAAAEPEPTADETATVAETSSEPKKALESSRDQIARLMAAARAHRRQNRPRDAYRSARAAEALAAAEGITFGPDDDPPAALVRAMREALVNGETAPRCEDVAAAGTAEETPTATADAALPTVDPTAFDPPAATDTPAAPRAASSGVPAMTVSAKNAVSSKNLIVEADRLPSRFEQDRRPRAVLRPNHGPAVEGVVTLPEQTVSAKPASPAAADALVRVGGSAGVVVEIEGPHEATPIPSGLALDQPNPEALATTSQPVPSPQDLPAPATPAPPMLASAATASAPTPAVVVAPPMAVSSAEAASAAVPPMAVQPVSAPVAAVPPMMVPPAPSADGPAPPSRSLRNIQWDEAPPTQPETAGLPTWWPLAAGGGMMALSALIWWRGRRRA